MEDGCEDSIQVVVRIKPGSDDQSVIYNHNEIKLDRHTFAFDRIFPPAAQQEDIFTAVGKKLIAHTLEGYNSCIFAYGQTGSGKTYTMMGDNSGLMQRSFCELFNKIARMPNNECIITCSYYELYNEQIIDLLDNRKDKKNLNIRQDVKKGMFVQNLIEESALTADKLLECLMMGMKNRHIGETLMNRESSRSHSIFTVSLAMKQEDSNKKVLKTSKLHFVDLAGSQRQKMTMSTGQRLKQAGNINKSLTSLGMVINALASDKPKTHIPYRDSKLTCLLKDSLGGNSKTFIVATISTSILCFQQTLSTLNFANRAKMVKVKALINEESLSTNIEQYKEEIRRLKQEIAKIKSDKKSPLDYTNNFALESLISKNNTDLEYKFQEISNKIQGLKEGLMNNSLQNMIDIINRSKPEHEMIDETVPLGSEQQGNELVEYMASNHELLKKIHSTMKEYSDLKEEIKHIQFNKRMPFQEMKTPSKFQRQQYEELLNKRQVHIKDLQERLVSIKQQIFKKELESKDLKKKMSTIMETKQSNSNEQILTLRIDYSELQKRYNQTLLSLDKTRDQSFKKELMNKELQSRLKQSKELYLYFQDKYENEKFVKAKLQNNLKELNKKVQNLQSQKRQEVEDYIDKIQILEEKMQEMQRRQEEVKNQNDILNETLEFNQKKIREYSEKLHENNRQINEYSLREFSHHEKINQALFQKQKYRVELQNVISSLNVAKNQHKNNIELLNFRYDELRDRNQALYRDYEGLKMQKNVRINSLNEELMTWQRKHRQNMELLDQFYLKQRQQTNEYNATTFGLQKTINHMKIQLQMLSQDKKLIQEQLKEEQRLRSYEQQSYQQKQQTLVAQNERYRESLQVLNKKLEAQQDFRKKYKNVVQQFQELKKSYKQILTLNYKLKGQYYTTFSNSQNESTKNQQLLSKVVFYEEKFKLMSIEYNKSQDIIKKLKHKEIGLLKDLQFYKESEKLKKFSNSSEADEVFAQNMKALQLQNAQLKEEIEKMKKMYENVMKAQKQEDYSIRINLQNERYELSQKEEKIKKKMENALKNWDHTKENNYEGMNIDELLNCWQKIEMESRKKIEGIGKAIKRQQKLQSQNRFIIKQNNFLKERIDQFQKQLNLQALGNPRKLMKLQNQGL